MKRQISIAVFLGLIPFGLCNHLYAWGNRETHPAITNRAVAISAIDRYLKAQVGLRNGVTSELAWDFPLDIKQRIEKGKASPEQTTRTILEWAELGSTIEDEDGRIWPIRARHHFHDPYRNAGLDNQTDHLNWQDYGCTKTGFDLTGESALVWTTDGTAAKEPTVNNQYWGNARNHLFAALTQAAKAGRQEYLAVTLLDFGCVLHLIEDMGVPAHTRNDFLFAHYRSALNNGNPFESWVEDQVKANGGQSPWSGSGPVVFDKLAKYFDADEYAGDYLGDAKTLNSGE